MKRIVLLLVIAGIVFALGYGAAVNAAGKSYQFTGTVKASEGGILTVEKSAKETWTFVTDKDTKGSAKVGDKVTVYYKMVATEVETKTAPPPKKTK